MYQHIANGHATTSLIAGSGLPGDTSVWADVLHHGPVPAGIDDDALRSIRARHIADWLGGVRYEDVLTDLASWELPIARSASCRELVLWFEHDLFDQLNLIQVLDRIRTAARRAPIVSLVCVGSFPGHPFFKGLGELTPAELASLFPLREPVTSPQYDLAAAAWRAFQSSTPEATEALLRGDTRPLPFLAPALRRHLEEFPSTAGGLSRTERRLLQLAAAGPIEVRSALPRMHEGEEAFYIADASLLALARELAASTPPLLSPAMQATPDGLAVLSGQADRVRLCGIDRWLGGVHLSGHGRVWRRDPGGSSAGGHMRII